MSTSDILESLIEKDNGYLITSKAVESGVSKPSVSKYVREHDMEKVAHGIYILDDVWPDELFVLQQRNKNIIYSGETALYLHGLIDREYSHICFTVPTGYNATHIKKHNKGEYKMPKMKTRRAAAKRFTETGSGQFKRNKAFKSHILEKKSPKRKRNFRKAALVSKSDYKRVARLLPNG